MNRIPPTLVTLLSIACFAACEKTPNPVSIPSGPFADAIHGVGYTEPAGEVRELAFRHPGIIGEVLVREGQDVAKGEVLARLHNEEECRMVGTAEAELKVAQAELKQLAAGVNPARIQAAKASLDSAKAELRRREREFHRMEASFETQSLAEIELDAARSLHEQALANLATSQAELHHMENYVRPEDLALAQAKCEVAAAALAEALARKAETELRAPISGKVLDLLKRPGDSSGGSAGSPVCLLGDTSAIYIRAEIDERFALAVEPGQSATVLLPGGTASELRGSVAEILPIMGRKTVFSRDADERRDLDVRQVLIKMEAGIEVPVGLKVDVRIQVESP